MPDEFMITGDEVTNMFTYLHKMHTILVAVIPPEGDEIKLRLKQLLEEIDQIETTTHWNLEIYKVDDHRHHRYMRWWHAKSSDSID